MAIGENNRVRLLEVGSWKSLATVEQINEDRLSTCPVEVSFYGDNDKLLIYSCDELRIYYAGTLQQFSISSLAVTGESLSFINGIGKLAV